MSIESVRAEAWNTALLTLLVEHEELGGEALMAAVLEEASNAMARLQEAGLIGHDPDDDDEA
jgi:hypothetical protein